MLRQLREGDADAVVALYRTAFGDARPIDAAEIVSWYRSSEIKSDCLRVLEVDGCVVGYGDISIDNDDVALEVAAPGRWDAFLEWAEESARAVGASRARVPTYSSQELAAAAERRGYRLWRSAYTMQVTLADAALPTPRLPLGIKVHGYGPDDLDVLRAALNEVFAKDPFFHEATPSNFRELYLGARGFDPSLWLLAWDRAELAGFVLAYPERVGIESLGWVGSLGVLPHWRGRGLGEALLQAAFRELSSRGLAAVGLGVDSANETGALRLYERVGMGVVQRADNWVLHL